MGEVELGKLIDGVAFRDAIHVAVIPRNASEMLRPGQRVGLIGDTEAGPSAECIGIVDPYLTDVVPKGRAFWLCILPNTVTGMRHHWEHPQFDNLAPIEGCGELRQHAEAWLRDQCEQLGMEFEELTDQSGDLLNGIPVRTWKNEDAQDHWYEIQDEFWRQIEIYHGKRIEEEDRGSFYCSC